MARLLRILAGSLTWLIVTGCTAWSAGAIYFDFPCSALRGAACLILCIIYLAAAIFVRNRWGKIGAMGAIFAIVLAWWLTLQPSNERAWQPDMDRTAWAEIKGDEVTLHNVRNCDYRTETDYTPRWETRIVHLSQIVGVDLAVNYWGSPWMAHPIVSFQFADSLPVCFSIETRKENGESYSPLGGLYRQFELIYITADERDAIRLRTNFRKGEDVYLYHTTKSAEAGRAQFREYLTALNYLHEHPVWYNALTTNCTTAIRLQRDPAKRSPWDWRMLVNGKGDEMLFERQALETYGLTFQELKYRSRINTIAQKLDAGEDFSRQLRMNHTAFK